MAGPKVVVIGAGSLFFGRQAIWQMITSEHLNSGTLALVDTDPVHLARMAGLARKAIDHKGVPLKLEVSEDRRDVLAGADFVVLSFAWKSVKHRALDCELSAKYGIRMCSGDTIGPGGMMRALREFPHILACARDVEELCPEAWLINYINPAATNGIGLKIYAPQLKTFALCDSHHMPYKKAVYARRAGIISKDATLSPEQDADFDFRIAGPNHFTFLVKAEYKGKDCMPKIAESLRQSAATESDGGDAGAKAAFNETVTYELYKALGYIPTCTGHTKEYVRYWQGLNTVEDRIPPLQLWDHIPRYERHWDMWNEVDAFNHDTRPMGEFFEITKADHATDIIETMWAGLKKPFYINQPQGEAIPNMPADAFHELLSDATMDGIVPRFVGDAPVGLRGLWQQVLDAHELTARAAVEGDRDLLYRAFACDPLAQSLVDNKALMDELLDAERAALPDYWFK